MALSDVLAGFAEAGHEHQTNLIQMAYRQRDQLAAAYGKLMQDPSYPEEARGQFGQAFQDIVTSDPFKLPQTLKKYQDMTIKVQPPAGPPVPQNLSVAPQAAGAPQANAGAAGGVSAGMPAVLGRSVPDIAPPTPPPVTQSLFAPMSFDEQLRRQGAEEKQKFETTTKPSELLKLWQPKPTGAKGVEVDKEGNAFQSVQQRYLDPADTSGSPDGTWKTFNQTSTTPLRKFAPRASGELNVEDAIKLQAEDPTLIFKHEGSDQPIDLQAVAKTMPDATLRHTGSGQYQINSQKYKTTTINNQVVPVPQTPPSGGPTASTIGGPLGVAHTGTESNSVNLPAGVDATGNLIPGQTSTVRTPITPGMSPAPPPSAGGTAAPVTAPAPVAPTAAPAAPKPGIKNAPPRMPNSQLNAQRQIAMPTREVAASLYPDPRFPGAPTLENYGYIAADPEARHRVGGAIDQILHFVSAMPDGGAGALKYIPLAGDLAAWLENHGIKQELARSNAYSLQKTLGELSPEERNAVHQVISSYGTIPGLRVATKGSAYQFYVKNLELELPTFSNVGSGGEWHTKLGILGRDLVNAQINLNPSVVSPEEKQRYQVATMRNFALGRLSDKELQTTQVSRDGTKIQYRENGSGAPKVIDVTMAPTPLK